MNELRNAFTMNILWITTDHQQWRTIAGRSACRMPNLQRLIDRGLLFHRPYAPMSVCCPVRAMWASGAWPWHNGVYTQVHSAPSISRDMWPGVVGYADRLRDAGYRTGFVGKWHASQVRPPFHFGFDEVAYPRSCPGALPPGKAFRPEPALPADLPPMRYTPVRQFRWPGSEPFDMWGHNEGPVERLGTHRLAAAACELLAEFAAAHRPWHLAVHFPEPHDAYRPHVRFLEGYDPAEMPVPASFHDDFAGKPGMHRRESETWGHFDERDVRQGTAYYFAYCTQIDDAVGRILDALDATGQTDDTLIAFCCDHGDLVGAHHMWIKSWMPYEEDWRMPMFLAGPGVPAGGVTDHLVQTHDLPHTFCELAGAEPLPHPDGRPLLPLLAEPARDDWEDAVLCACYGCEFFVTMRMVITPRYKLVANGFDYDELYDLANDPDEMHNLIRDPAHAAALSELRAKLYELMTRCGDPYGDRPAEGLPGAGRLSRYGGPRYWPRK